MLFLVSTSLIADDFVFDKETNRAVPAFIGQVTLFKGKVFVTKKDVTKEISHGERFATGDKVKTAEKSIVKILMIDDTVLTLGPKSEINLSEFEFTDKTNRKSLFELVEGQLSSEVKNKAKDKDLTYRTRYVAMGVRGTRLLVNFHSEGNRDITQFALTEGKAVVDTQVIVKGDHLVFVHDQEKKNGANEKFAMTAEEVQKLAGENIDEDTEFRPLLPYFQLAMISPNSPLWPFSNKVLEVVSTQGTEERPKLVKKSPSWEKNLEQLNQKLRDGQSKK